MEEDSGRGVEGVYPASTSRRAVLALWGPRDYAELCGVVEAGHWLRGAKISFIACAHQPPRGRQILGSTSRERRGGAEVIYILGFISWYILSSCGEWGTSRMRTTSDIGESSIKSTVYVQ